METNLRNSPDFALHVYRTQNIRDNTLDDAQLETRCPLDNGLHDCTPISTCSPLELLIEVLLQLDIPSLTRFRGLNRRTMELVNSVHQYTAIIEHCSNTIRAIVSIEADTFDCGKLYGTLCTSRCYTCNRFGDHLYLIDCRRVCYFCFTRWPEYFPLTSREAYRFFTPNTKPQSKSKSSRKLLELAKPPSILSLPGREPKRFMAIISAPVLLNGGRQVDQGFFCLGCRDETEEETKHFRIKYTTEDMSEHIASYGRVVERTPRTPGRFMHVTKDQITPY
ncbi:uncharacterized protein LAESUDRAFT_736119 [Laetiporus sulphureus 93-53]|uniref:F-box domain-containing protein n=1 Tax=Laetiporus sulphureus 93-53 TaxID=1314785 RepID=A0A165F2R6_9APHY|nr:uncharacterized protein LAESUDRAFT_736119 [Laetiporus sulphureus 93-53]KZT08250.1 hypothetical protein LAESUDRAFT_736119 [Laetiporus sulphureus 93-53]